MFVGQLINRKGVDLIIDLANSKNIQKNKNFFLRIVGEGKYKSEILKLENNSAEMEDSLKKIKNTYPWVWGENDDEEHRREILDLFIQENK